MVGALTLTGDLSGVAVCELTRPTTVTVATVPPTIMAATVLRIVPTNAPPRFVRSIASSHPRLLLASHPARAGSAPGPADRDGGGPRPRDEHQPGQRHRHRPPGRDLPLDDV